MSSSLSDNDDEKELKQKYLKDFFSIKQRRGRPRKANTASDIFPFGELIDEFIYGANVTYMMASIGNVKIMGAVGRNKKITSGDFCDTITMLRTSSSAGT